MPAKHYDVAVIGGGIHGAGVAQAAAAAGYSTCLLERSAPAAGTSSRSSKLIHGGLRYLETGQFALVRECLREREILLRIAPDLVHLKPFFIPVYRHSRRRALTIATGLSAYYVLGGLHLHASFTRIARSRWADLDGLTTQDLQAVFQYNDAQTDDAALTRAVVHSAVTLGAEPLIPAEFLSARFESGQWTVEYRQTTERRCTAKALVNAAGPWANTILGRIMPPAAARPIEWIQGTHILVDGRLEHGIYYLEAPTDRRPVFVMPWREQILVGTTEVPFSGSPDQVLPSPEEKAYLLETLSAYFPRFQSIDTARVRNAFAGLRVFSRSSTAASARPRETIIHQDPHHPSLITIYGGKLTVYRATAQTVLARLVPILGPRKTRADTATVKLIPPR